MNNYINIYKYCSFLSEETKIKIKIKKPSVNKKPATQLNLQSNKSNSYTKEAKNAMRAK